MATNIRWYNRKLWVVILLIVFAPIGLLALWFGNAFGKKGKIIATIIVASLLIIGLQANREEQKYAKAHHEPFKTVSSSRPTPPKTAMAHHMAKPYKVFHEEDFSFPGRSCRSWRILAPTATTSEERAHTAIKAAMTFSAT